MTKPAMEGSGCLPAGYKMIESAEINNFRGLQEVKLSDCQRINLIVGRNGSGKTSLLEALFLGAGGSAEIAFRLKSLRGYEGAAAGGGNDEVTEELYRDLFYRFNKKLTVRVALLGSEFRNRTMTIKFGEHLATTNVARRKDQDDEAEILPISFHWIGPSGKQVTVKPRLRDQRVIIPRPLGLPEEIFFFSATHNFSPSETARRLADLARTFRDAEVVEKFTEHFPDVTMLSIDVVGGSPMVSAKFRDLPEKVPLNLISSGMTKLASILFAIAHKKGGVLLIDEIENGIYFRLFPKLWETLLTFCKQNDAQVFVSSHSGECIRAAAEVAQTNPGDFSLIQTNSKGSVRQFSGSRFADAVNEDVDIR